MFELPLFPLHTVLFPGMPLSLRIFEPRYLHMIEKCIDDRQPFGAVLIRHGREALGPLAEPYMIGCTARVLRVERKLTGGINIIAVGGERFEILSLDQQDDYLIGDVQNLKFLQETSLALNYQADRLRPWVQTYVDLLRNADMVQDVPLVLPPNPIELANMGAFLLQISSKKKQALLEAENSIEMLQDVRYYFRREVALARKMLEAPKPVKGVAGRLN